MTEIEDEEPSDEEKEIEVKKRQIEEQELENWYKLCSTCGKPPNEYGRYPCSCEGKIENE